MRYVCGGVLDREDDQPALEYSNGSRFWYTKGKLNRDYGLPAGINRDGCPLWFVNDHPVNKARSFDLAIQSRKSKFGLFLVLFWLVEDDLFVLIGLNWKF